MPALLPVSEPVVAVGVVAVVAVPAAPLVVPAAAVPASLVAVGVVAADVAVPPEELEPVLSAEVVPALDEVVDPDPVCVDDGWPRTNVAEIERNSNCSTTWPESSFVPCVWLEGVN